jgi:2'-5' RNA ligase
VTDSPRPRRTGLVLLVPPADPVVGRWRDRYDPHAALGVPAHVTVLFPWIPADAVTPADESALAALAATRPVFTLTFAAFGEFPGTLFLEPTPADPVLHLTDAVTTRWPGYPPYEGRFDGVHPHLTIADHVAPDAFPPVTADIAPHLPIRADITHLTLVEETPEGRWRLRRSYPLSGS